MLTVNICDEQKNISFPCIRRGLRTRALFLVLDSSAKAVALEDTDMCKKGEILEGWSMYYYTPFSGKIVLESS